MTPFPETRESLIRRLPNLADAEAWDAFVEIYEPLLFRLARGRGMQQADAEDFVQEVLAAVARAVERWLAEKNRGPFRAWLFRIASNLAVNFLTRPKHQRLGTGDERTAQRLAEQPASAQDSSELFLAEYRRELFRWAAERIRGTVSERQWTAFWLSTIGGRPIASVARQLGVSVGSVYISRSRVAKRIRETIQNHEQSWRAT